MRQEVRALAEKFLTGIKPSGENDLLAKCPIHRKPDGSMERTPSFRLSTAKGVWKCFSCGEKGNLYQLLRVLGENPIKYEKLLGSIRYEAAPVKNALKPDVIEKPIEPVPERILGLFDMCPATLVDDDLFLEETLRYFDVGFDEVHQRITFPLRDLTGTLVGFSGRAVVECSQRYKVYTKEYADFGMEPRSTIEKSRILWNAHRIYPEACFGPLATPLVVVEGFKACMRVYEAGWENVVALLGSSISYDQTWILNRIGAPVILMLDQNKAGVGATHAVGRSLINSLNVRVAGHYDGDQPSDLNSLQVQQSIQQALPFTTWSFSNRLEKKERRK